MVSVLPYVPRALVGLVARPYLAGESLASAVRTIGELMDEGCSATIDVLGEEVKRRDEAQSYTDQYIDTLDRIELEGLDSNVSVKLSAMGLRLDRSLTESNLRRVVERAMEVGNFVRIDMEDSTTTDATFELYRRLRQDFDNLGLVLQSRLRRTRQDVADLLPLRPSVRVVKGIYLENPSNAYQDAQEIRDQFMLIAEDLLRAGCRVGLATHDTQLIERSLELIDKLGVEKDHYELQMLLGVARNHRRELVAAGHSLRVYIPYGVNWYAYSMRRLKENPEVAGHVLKNTILLGR